MIKTFDGIVDGKHVQRWQPTEEEKARILDRIEEIKKSARRHRQTERPAAPESSSAD